MLDLCGEIGKFGTTNLFAKGVIVTTTTILPIRTVIYLVAGMLCLPPVAAQADFFKYKDSSGAVVITNKFEDIPKKYRNSVKVVWDSELEAKDPLARRRAAAASAQREQQERQQASRQTQASSPEKKRSTKEKKLVITLDENTGEVIRKFE